MRELREEELQQVHGGSTNPQTIPVNWSIPVPSQSFGRETMLHRERAALARLKGHTLMDQISNDS